MDVLFSDIRVALRQLARTPTFTATALVTLALGIGATTAVFSLLNGIVLRPLGFASPDRLVYVQATDPSGGAESISPQDLIDYQARTHSFTAMAAVDGGASMNLTRPEAAALRVRAARVGGSFFSILGVSAQQGRFFGPGSDAKSAPKVVVLSDAAWRRYFGADAHIVGRQITLDNDSYTVVGVASPQLTFPARPDIWYPAVWKSWETGDIMRGYHSIHAIARLAPGVTLDAARGDLAAVSGRIARDFPKYDARVTAVPVTLREHLLGDTVRPLWILFGAVAFVLLIACANVGNLMLVRAASRQSEIALRTALGASRSRLVRQFLTESTLLALCGTVLGALLAAWTMAAVVRFGPADLPRLGEVAVDGRVAAFAVGVGLLAGIGFGLLPALHFARPDLARSLHSNARSTAAGARRTHSMLVVAELALGTVLLVGAGLLIRSFQRTMSVDPGFRPDHAIVFDAALTDKKYQYDAETNVYVDEVQSRLAAIPGVTGAAVAANRPFDTDPGFEASTSFTIDGLPKPALGDEPESRLLPVSPSFFQALAMTVIKGRTFTDADNRRDAAPVVVINQALAEKYFPGQNPIGKHITFGISHTASASDADSLRSRGEIIGIVRTVQNKSLRANPEPASYLPYHLAPFGPAFVVRTAAEPAVVEREIRDVMASVDRNVPIYGMQTLRDAISTSVAQPRFYTVACAVFAMVALVLAAVGIFGVVSYAVTQRTREFGIRIALGATTGGVVALVLRSSTRLAAAGLALGVAGAIATTRAMGGLLFEVKPIDPLTFTLVCIVLGGAATLAAWLPARRGANVDPATAMRAD